MTPWSNEPLDDDDGPPFAFGMPSPNPPEGRPLIGVKTPLGMARMRRTPSGKAWLTGDEFDLPMTHFAPDTLEPIYGPARPAPGSVLSTDEALPRMGGAVQRSTPSRVVQPYGDQYGGDVDLGDVRSLDDVLGPDGSTRRGPRSELLVRTGAVGEALQAAGLFGNAYKTAKSYGRAATPAEGNADVLDQRQIIRDPNYWTVAIADKKGRFRGHVRVGEYGWTFYDRDGREIRRVDHPRNFHSLEGARLQEELAYQDSTPFAKGVKGLADVAVDGVTFGLGSKAGWIANGGSAGDDLILAKEIAYEMRKLQLKDRWRPEMPDI